MARPPRIVLPDQPAHIVQRGHNRQSVFFDPLDYRQYLSHLADAARKTACEVHAYVLMLPSALITSRLPLLKSKCCPAGDQAGKASLLPGVFVRLTGFEPSRLME